MQIKKITYQEDEVIFELIDGNKRYKLQINRLKDLHDEQTVEKWCKYINKNFDGDEEEKLDEDLLFFANWIEGENKKYSQNTS